MLNHVREFLLDPTGEHATLHVGREHHPQLGLRLRHVLPEIMSLADAMFAHLCEGAICPTPLPECGASSGALIRGGCPFKGAFGVERPQGGQCSV